MCIKVLCSYVFLIYCILYSVTIYVIKGICIVLLGQLCIYQVRLGYVLGYVSVKSTFVDIALLLQCVCRVLESN